MKWKQSPIVPLDALSQGLVDNLCGIIWKIEHGHELNETESQLYYRIGEAEPAE